jgi:hypothetical protein
MADTSLRASVTFVNLSRTATYVVPVSEIDYILLASSARMDTSGLFRFNAETIGIADSSVFTFSTPITDSSTIADISALSFVPATKTDSVTPSDSSVRTPQLGKTETISVADTDVKAFTLGTVTESLAASDSSVLDFQMPVAETVSFSDITLVVLIFIRDVFDTTTLSDTPSLSFTPDTKVETVTSGDSSSYAFDQFLTEAFAMNDLADVGDGISFDFIDFTANVVTITEAAVISTAPFATDSFSLADAGVGSIQDYCDITYFAEDYVGIQFTF